MLVEMINRLLELGVPTTLQFHDLPYTDKPLSLVKPPGVAVAKLSTLTGLVDAIRAGLDDLEPAKWLLVVNSHGYVSLESRSTDKFGSRACLVDATRHDGDPFPFARFMNREEFVIGLQSKFVQSGDLTSVLQLASSLEASKVSLAEDDGISQKTTVKQGVVLKQQTVVKGRVSLRPYRTFREVEQPASEFVFRLRSEDGEVPQCALFEADGGKWKLDAVLTIKQWLEAQNLGLPVIA
jgi:hypothetical protein